VLDVLEPTRFRLLGRSNDLVNVAGKRSSLAHLNHHLNSIEGVRDGAFWLPPDSGESVVRLVARGGRAELDRESLLAAAARTGGRGLPAAAGSAAWTACPRDPTGKLPPDAWRNS
jgi:acyl-coenzyme A synthetase/AMP-(fatty) acid ligase